MKILVISTLKRKVTADETASRSQIIFKLVSYLAKKGHRVSLLETKDRLIPGVDTIPVIEKGWVDLPPVENPFLLEVATLVQLTKKIVEIQDRFDIIHNHIYTVIHNGVDTNLFTFQEKKDDYLLWIGRLSKAKNADGTYMDPKGVKWAIKLAKQTNSKLIITGNVEDMDFYNSDVKPYLSEQIAWYGPVSSKQELKQTEIAKLMQNAKAFLMTVNWCEPFGLEIGRAHV